MTITTALPPRPAAETGPTVGARSRPGDAPSAGAAAFADLLHSAPGGAADKPTATPDPEPSAADAAPLADVPAESPAANSAEPPTGPVAATATPTATPAAALQGLSFPLALPGQPSSAAAESALPTSVPAHAPAPASAPAAAVGTATLGTDGRSAAMGSPAAAAAVAAAASSVAVPTGTPTPRTAAAAAITAAAADSSAASSPTVPSNIPLGGSPAAAGAAPGIGTAPGVAPATVPNVLPAPVAAPSAASTAVASSAATPVAPETAAPDPGIPTPTSGERGTASVAWPLGSVAAPGSAPVASAATAQATPAASTPLASQVVRPLFSLATAGPGEHTLSISVTPDNLGPVVVRAQISASGMRLELFAPTELARDALRLILPDLRRDLAGGGLPASLDLSTRSQPGEAGFSGRHDRPAPDLAGHGGAGFGGDARGSQDGSRDPAPVNPWLRAASVGLAATGPPGADAAAHPGPGTTGRVDVLA